MYRSRWARNPAAFIEDAGFTGIVATNSEFEIERYPRLGDVISVTQVFEDISDEKKTSLGTGHFITWLATYTDQNGEVLGRQRFRVFRFKAAGTAGRADGDADWHRQSARTPSSSGRGCATTSC